MEDKSEQTAGSRGDDAEAQLIAEAVTLHQDIVKSSSSSSSSSPTVLKSNRRDYGRKTGENVPASGVSSSSVSGTKRIRHDYGRKTDEIDPSSGGSGLLTSSSSSSSDPAVKRTCLDESVFSADIIISGGVSSLLTSPCLLRSLLQIRKGPNLIVLKPSRIPTKLMLISSVFASVAFCFHSIKFPTRNHC